MSLRIYLDDCTSSKRLTARLRAAGYDVQTPHEAGTAGLPDAEHLHHAIREARVLMTHNCGDFEILHRETLVHPGIVAIYQDNDSHRDMTVDDVVRALQRLETSGVTLANDFHVLNVWR